VIQGLNIPDGFATTSEAYFYFLKETGIENKIKTIVDKINVNNIKDLQKKSKELQTLIFDRWGELLYESQQLKSKWNGVYIGKMCVEDVYVYKIRAKDVFYEWHEYIGKITLLK